ncbi:MAG: adenylyltransferase/cytidyltransferase family protein [Clostridiaceae bacterium]|nr:adenylyltransferase/cytidyltransferase family protein [Clostridiaceae bacterium]
MNEGKYKIGYTTGVFDMFHIGHLNLLRQAKERCQVLIVGVSTDEVVRTYKDKIPVVAFEQRKQIVEAIRYVDFVVPQSSMDKMEAWNILHFDAIFHGDDWKGTGLYRDYEECFRQKGVDIVYLPHTDGVSSTLLRNMISKEV